MTIRQKYDDLQNQYATLVGAAETAFEAEDVENFNANLAAAKALLPELDQLEDALKVTERKPAKLTNAQDIKGEDEAQTYTKADLKGMTPAEINDLYETGKLNGLLDIH